MHSIDPILERMLGTLAHELGYDLSAGEVNLYREELTGYPIWLLADVFVEARDFVKATYPSLAWFKARLSAKLLETSKRA